MSQARDDSSARSRTAPTPKLRDTDDIVPEQDDSFASATDLTETEIGDAHTLVTLSPTTGSIFKAEEPTGPISDPNGSTRYHLGLNDGHSTCPSKR